MNRYTTSAWACIHAVFAILMWSTLASAEMAVDKTLPREFQGARLGMALEKITRIAPQAVKRGQSHGDRLVHVGSNDPHIDHIEYRFAQGRLYEEAIHYNRRRLPRGYSGLVDRLREIYGRPVSEDVIELNPSSDVLSSQKTVWEDHDTRIAVAELQKWRNGGEYYDLVLTMTDLTLERARQQAAEALRREEERRIPVPLPGGSSNERLSAGSTVGLPTYAAKS
ncbi:MAG TPA: hypothetical protein VJ746_20750 [Nitrospira sp.]|nr:hypothetical protein [Nitrospira sp.]